MSELSADAPVLRERPPGPPALPLLGNLHQFVGRPLDFLHDLRKGHGDVSYFWIGAHEFWLLCDPDAIETVLLREAKKIKKDHIYEKIAALLGQGLVTSEGELWRRQRKIASRPFAAKQVDGYAAQIRDICDRHLEAATGERDVFADMNALAEAIVLEVLFGLPTDTGADEVGPAIATWMAQFQAEDSSILRIVPPWVPTPGRRRARQAESTIDRFLYQLVQDKRAAGATGDDVLSRLIVAADDEEGGMSDRQLRDEAVTLYVAGHETTALALTYTLRQLALHPEWQDRLRAEVRRLPDGPRTAADVRGMPIADAILKEAMRLHPPAWAIGRESLEDLVIAGRHCPAGTQLVISQWVMHRDPRWFDEPERFDPQRWLDGLEQRLPRFVYLPFGGGPRVCIGNHFAMMEAVIALSVLLRDRAVEPAGNLDLDLVPSVTLRPSGPVRLRYVEAP